MATLSNPSDASERTHDHEYLDASNTNVSNFVSVKLSGDRNYHLWKKQMQCLMKAHGLYVLVDDRPANKEIMNKINKNNKYDSLIQGWILGSLSEEVLGIVVNCISATEVWKDLKGYFDSPKSSQQDSCPITREDTKTETKDKNVVSAKTTANDKETDNDDKVTLKKPAEAILDIRSEDKDIDSAESKAKCGQTTQTKTKDSDPTKEENKERKDENAETKKAKLDWINVLSQLLFNKIVIRAEDLNNDAKTALHIAVVARHNNLIRKVLRRLSGDLTGIKNSEDSTLLHSAAIVGNTYAARLLIEKEKRLIDTRDKKNQTPLDKAYENMHLGIIDCLLEAAEQKRKEKKKKPVSDDGKASGVDSEDSDLPLNEIGAKVLVNAISAKHYNYAIKWFERNPKYATCDDSVLMALAKSFPSGLEYYEETLIYPISDNIYETIVKRSKTLYSTLVDGSGVMKDIMSTILRCEESFQEAVLEGLWLILIVSILMLYLNYLLIALLLLMVYYPFSILYHLLWKVASTVVPFPPIWNMEQKKKKYDQAKAILRLICKRIEVKYNTNPRSFFEGPFLEAARQNASEVVKEIIDIWPEAIQCTDKNGYDVIQLATIHRSEKVYNLIYDPWFPKSIYRTKTDSSLNNMLHLAGRLAPPNKLKLRTGAALQLQRELQWREEVKKLLYPSCVTAENIFHQTPEMVFTKEHENLVKEGEAWIKTVAESCSITATLITTIVFAAAITVPGGSRQDTGVPVFMNETAFLVFAISDAISLFSSVTALLLFLSILTARFAEEDFLFSLPKRLIIGLCNLLISTAAMMVAFGSNLFLVFCHDKMWMLAPICGLAFLPIAIFCVLQVPLIIDLFRSTCVSMFGKGNQDSSIFDPSDLRFFFGK